jgi:lipopolysaccharide export system protein LptA
MASFIRVSAMLRLSVAVMGLLVLQPAMARTDDRNQPMHVVHADSADVYNTPNSMSTFKGNVLVIQGTLKLTGDLVKVFTHKDDTGVDHIIVTGTPKKQPHIEQIDDEGNLMTGDADQLYYESDTGIAILTGNAFVHQATKGDAHGDKLTYNNNTSYMTAESKSGGAVVMTFLPKPKPVAPAKPGATAPAKPAATTPVPSTVKPASSSSSPAAPAPASSSATPNKG